MKNILKLGLGIASVAALLLPVAAASAASVAIQSLSPGTTVTANSLVSFKIVPTGFTAQSYQLTDSFGSLSTAAVNDIDPGGNFSWAPSGRDAGVHILTITANDNSGDSAVATQTITVLPPPSVTIGSVSPIGNIAAGTKFSFAVTLTGFSNPSYSVSDSFGGSSATTVIIDPSGNFSWTPDASQNGDHTITIYVYDSLGHSASAMQAVTVGAGPTLTVQSLVPGPNVAFGTTTSFTVTAANFIPTGFSLVDNFPGTSLSNDNINTTGVFSWVPRVTDVGLHLINIKGMVGAYGKSATTSVSITVLGPTTTAAPASPSAIVQAAVQSVAVPIAPSVTTVSSPTSPMSSGGDGYVFKNFIGLGEDVTDGSDVLELQKRLAVVGTYAGKQSGYFGPQTEAAVKRFQKAHHIPATGFVGIATRAALNK